MKKLILALLFIAMSISPVYAAPNIVLTWEPPTMNMDDTPLTDLGGYKVYFGSESGVYGNVVDVGNVVTYTTTSLPDGTYYFSVTAYDFYGNESGYSNECIKIMDTTVPKPPGGFQCSLQ